MSRVKVVELVFQPPPARVLRERFFLPMRFVKALRFLFLLSLTLGLFGGEISESIRLADDTSNDFVQVSAMHIHKCLEIASGHLFFQGSVGVAEELVPNLVFVPFAKPAPSSASDLLRLLSIQRK